MSKHSDLFIMKLITQFLNFSKKKTTFEQNSNVIFLGYLCHVKDFMNILHT